MYSTRNRSRSAVAVFAVAGVSAAALLMSGAAQAETVDPVPAAPTAGVSVQPVPGSPGSTSEQKSDAYISDDLSVECWIADTADESVEKFTWEVEFDEDEQAFFLPEGQAGYEERDLGETEVFSCGNIQGQNVLELGPAEPVTLEELAAE